MVPYVYIPLTYTRNDKYELSMDNLKPLDAQNLNGDIVENWRYWKQRWNLR